MKKDAVYKDNYLHLPKDKVNVRALEAALTMTPNASYQRAAGMQIPVITAYEDEGTHLRVPRYFFSHEELKNFGLRIIDHKPRFDKVEYSSDIVPRDEHQAEAICAMVSSNGGIIEMSCGKGKALAHGEPVQTVNGPRPVEEINVGELVWGTDGCYYEVTGVYPQGERELYRVTFTDGTHCDCDGDHLWTLQKRRHRNKPLVTISTSDLATAKLRGADGRKLYLPPQKPIKGMKQNLRLDPYTLGSFLGDGHTDIFRSVFITTMDEEVLDRMVLPALHRFKELSHQSSGKAKTYLIAPNRADAQKTQELKESLHDLGLMRVKAKDKFVPDCYLLATVEDRLALLQGLLDTDGTPTIGGAAEFSTSSSALARDVMDLSYSLAGTATLQERDNYYTKNGEKVGPFKNYRVLVKLPEGMQPFLLSRKQKKMPNTRQREPYRAVDSVVRVGTNYATCISVNSPDSLFLTRNYAPTHNTIIAIQAIAMMCVPAIIIVHNTSFIEQWSAEIEKHLGVKPAVVQGDKREFGNLTIAMLHTLAQNEWDQEELDRFGVAVFDEAHHLAAPLFNKVCPMFPGKRFGLTATTEREDGLEDLYFHHLGSTLYTDLTMDLIPEVNFIKTSVKFTHDEMEEIRVGGAVNISKLRGALAVVEPRNDLILKEITEARENGRKILVLGHLVDHLKLLHGQCPDSGLCIGKVAPKKRGDILRNHDVVFGTIALAAEGLDAPWLDTLFLITPFKAAGLLRQAIGRIQRSLPGKKDPVVVVFQDDVRTCMSMLAKMKKFLREEDIPFFITKTEEDNDPNVR